MKRLSAFFMKSLIRKASADMATDEISRQLSLPLDGSYAARQESDGNNEFPVLSGRVAPAVIPELTTNFNFLVQVQNTLAASAQNFYIQIKLI